MIIDDNYIGWKKNSVVAAGCFKEINNFAASMAMAVLPEYSVFLPAKPSKNVLVYELIGWSLSLPIPLPEGLPMPLIHAICLTLAC